MNLFKQLTEQEVIEFKQWARDNYEPLTEINGLWHPVIQQECKVMNEEADEQFAEALDEALVYFQ